MRRAALAVALIAPACVARSVEDIAIACAADSDCPEGAWCDLRTSIYAVYSGSLVCHELAKRGLPHIVFDGFVVGGKVTPSVSVRRNDLAFFDVRLRNDTTYEEDVDLKVDGPACVVVTTVLDDDEVPLLAGNDFDYGVEAHPAVNCGSPAELVITAIVDKRPVVFKASITLTQ